MRDMKSLPKSLLLADSGLGPSDMPAGRVTVMPGGVSYEHMPVHLDGAGNERVVSSASGFGTLVAAGSA